MTRLSLLALLALAFSTVTLAAPQDDELGAVIDIGIHLRDANQLYLPCGTWFLVSRDSTRGISCRWHRGAGDPTAILSLNVSPDPPVPGAKMDVLVGVLAHETVVVSAPSLPLVTGVQFWLTVGFRRKPTHSLLYSVVPAI